MSVKRYDGGRLGKAERTPTGGYSIPARLTRTGVLSYTLPDGSTRRELRHPDEVFAEDSLRTLRAAAVTDLHPAEPVSASTWRRDSIGFVDTTIEREANRFVSSRILVQDAEAIARIDAGERKEISCGYSCELDATPGVYQGERYDAVQRTIRYNHVAIGPEGWGRAGKDVAMRLDAGDAFASDVWQNEREQSMTTIKVDGVDFDEAKIKALVARADTADKALASAKRARVVDTVRSELARKGLTLDEKKAEGSSEIDLLRELLAAVDPMFDAENPSEDYVRGVFAAYVKAQGKAKPEAAEKEPDAKPKPEVAPAPDAMDSLLAIRKDRSVGVQGTRNDGPTIVYENDSISAREKMLAANRMAATRPLRAVARG